MNFDPAFIVTHGMHITKQQWKTTTKQRWKKKKRHLTTPMARQSWPMGGLSEVKRERDIKQKIQNCSYYYLRYIKFLKIPYNSLLVLGFRVKCFETNPHTEVNLAFCTIIHSFRVLAPYHHVFWYCYRPHICHAEGTCRQNAFQEVSSLMKLVFVLCQRKDEPDNQGLPLA